MKLDHNLKGRLRLWQEIVFSFPFVHYFIESIGDWSYFPGRERVKGFSAPGASIYNRKKKHATDLSFNCQRHLCKNKKY